MNKIQVIIKNESGLHARPASLFINEATKYKSKLTIIKDGKEYNGKSIMGILSMGAAQGQDLEIIAEGDDEEQAITALKKLIDSNFDE